MATKDMYGLSSASDHDRIAKRKRVTIIITGKGGVGKSTVMNSFLGLTSNQAGTNHWPHGTPTDLHFSDSTVNDLEVRMIELPALVHCRESEAAGITSKLVDLTSGEVDVLLYCMNITSRIDKTELDNIDSITRLLGADIWKNAVFLLTWSDVAVHNGNDLEGLTKSFVRAIRKELDRKKMVTEVRSVYSDETTDSKKSDGIICIPVSKDPGKPKEWRESLAQLLIQKCKGVQTPCNIKHQTDDEWVMVSESDMQKNDVGMFENLFCYIRGIRFPSVNGCVALFYDTFVASDSDTCSERQAKCE